MTAKVEMPHRLERLRALTDKLDHLTDEAYLLLDAIPDLVCVWKGRRIYFANRAFHDILGLSREQVQDNRWVDFIHPDDVEHTLRVATAGEKIESLENRWIAADGRPVAVRWVSSAPSPGGYSLAIGTPVEGQHGAG